jgi:signal transduction histidine kinase
MYINWINMPDAKIPRSEIIKDTEHLLDEASQAIREISFKLSPHILKNFGLVEAIKSYVEKIQKSKSIVIQIESRFDERFNEITETILYRILCECINNTVKHANASNIIINFKKFTDRYRILFLDDGIGFDVKAALNKKSGNGLFNIQSRLESINSKMFIKSKPELGTKIYLTIRR